MNLLITQVTLKEIKLPKQPLKEHPEHQINQISKSIKKFGFNDPIAIDEHNDIIEGVGRVLAAQKLKLKSIPAIQLNHLNEAQKKAYRIAHNKICLNTEFNIEVLREEFNSLCQLDESLLTLTGFETGELDDLFKLPELSELAPELTESLNELKTVTCPHCGGSVHV